VTNATGLVTSHSLQEASVVRILIALAFFCTYGAAVALSITAVVRVVNVLSLLIGVIRDIPNVCVFNTVSG